MARHNYDPEACGALCSICPLRESGTPVPPKGPQDADAVIVAETPAYYEEQKGEPLVGPSGIKLNEILYAIGVKRDRLFLTNTILCRPEVPGETGSKRFDFKTYMAWLRKENMLRKKLAKERQEKIDPIPSPIDCCAPRLWGELGWHEHVARQRGQPNGAVVIAMGNFATKAIVGREGIMKLRGSPFIVDLSDPHRQPPSAPEVHDTNTITE